jgi:hypothetical protein
MIVPSMTLEEIRKEIDKEFPILYRKVGYVIHDLKKQLHKKQLDEGFTKCFDYTSKFKNQWIYRIHLHKKEVEKAAMVLFFDGKGICGIAIAADYSLIYHTGHFFRRYNERLNLNLVHTKDIMVAYMKENMVYAFKAYKQAAPGIYLVFGQVESGTVLGTLNEKLRIVKVNTFLPNDMLNNRQKDYAEKLKNAEAVDFDGFSEAARNIMKNENKIETESFEK